MVTVFRDATAEQAESGRAQRAIDELSWVGRIRDALDADRFVLYAQPIVPCTGSGEVSKEILVRMRGPSDEVILPGAFLPVAERYGMIGELDHWVISRACRRAAHGRVEVNVSAASFGDPSISAYVEDQIAASGVPPGNLVFELTETALVGDLEAGIEFARALTDLGCLLALDDFGTGYGGFSYLKRLPITYLKIDHEFVRGLATNAANQHVVDAIVNLARAFGQQTIAEGVECAATLDCLRRAGVDYAQGFYLGHQVPVRPAENQVGCSGPARSDVRLGDLAGTPRGLSSERTH